MKLRVDTALSSRAFTTTQPQLLAQVPDYNRTAAFLSNPDLLMESSKKTLKNKREEARKQRQGATVIRGTWPSSEKPTVHVGSVMSPWHWGLASVWGSGVESRIWGGSQLLLVWL